MSSYFFCKTASPVGAPLIGNPNTWNIGAGNHYSHLTNPFADPEPTRSATRQLGGKEKTRKHKKSKRHNIKRGKSKREKITVVSQNVVSLKLISV